MLFLNFDGKKNIERIKIHLKNSFMKVSHNIKVNEETNLRFYFCTFCLKINILEAFIKKN